MFDEIEDLCNELKSRTKDVSRVRFYISFGDEKTENLAKAIEYGDEKRLPKPFMRVTEEECRNEWGRLQGSLVAYVSGEEDNLEDVCEEIADRMTEDYKATAMEMGVPKVVTDGLRVGFEC